MEWTYVNWAFSGNYSYVGLLYELGGYEGTGLVVYELVSD